MNAQLRRLKPLLLSLASGVATAATAVSVPEVPVNSTTAGILASAVAGLAWGAIKLRGHWSKTGVGVKADNSTELLLDRLTKERDEAVTRLTKERDEALKEARMAWSSKNADSLELGSLRAENAFLKDTLQKNHEFMTSIRKGVQQVGQQVDAVKNRQENAMTRLTNSGNVPLDS